MKIAFLVGRIVVGVYFLLMALNHFSRLSMVAGYAASKGVPAPTVAVVVSGVLLVIGGLSILLGYKPHLGAVALIVFLVPVSVLIHNFWAEQGQAQMMDMTQFLKNMGLLGSALMFLGIPEPWPFAFGHRHTDITHQSSAHAEAAHAGAHG
jgi:putative oxidoreductase